MKPSKHLLLWWTALLLLWGLAACGGDTAPPLLPDAAVTLPAPVTAARTPQPDAVLSLPQPPPPGPIRPGCGDYRLLVTLESDAVSLGLRVAGPANVVDGVWTLSGPGLGAADETPLPHVINDHNRDLFGFEGNDAQDPVQATFLLLISGLRPGQRLLLEMGHEAPGESGSVITIANTTQGLDRPGPTLARITVTQAYQTISLDLCAATPMPLPATGPTITPRLVAFFYPWWSTTATPEPPAQCGGDDFGWVRAWQGRRIIVTAHLPIAQDDGEPIYRHTACWQQVRDDDGRSGWIYDVQDPAFLAEQMALAHAYGLDGFAVSVHGDNEVEMAFLQSKASPSPSKWVSGSRRSTKRRKPAGPATPRMTPPWWGNMCATWCAC